MFRKRNSASFKITFAQGIEGHLSQRCCQDYQKTLLSFKTLLIAFAATEEIFRVALQVSKTQKMWSDSNIPSLAKIELYTIKSLKNKQKDWVKYVHHC